MPLDDILDRRLLIISGKGGVGKTTIAAALGVLASKHNKRTLIAEVEGKNALSSLFGVEPLTPKPTQLGENLFGMNITPEEALEEYFDVQLHMKRVAKPLIASQLVDYVTHAAPGLRDILMLGKVWYAATRRKDFDVIVLDTPAAGHAVSMLRSPEGFLNAVPVGPLAGHTRGVLEWLQDPSEVSIHLVSMAEEMPVNETIETTGLLEERLGMNVATVLVNMLYPPVSANMQVNESFDSLQGPNDLISAAKTSGKALDSKAAKSLFDCANFYRARRQIQQEHRKELVESLEHTATILDLPYLFSEKFGLEDLRTLASRVEEQLTP